MQAQWKVGATQSQHYGGAQTHGHGFSIQDAKGEPLLVITYDSEEEASHAETIIRTAIEKAVDIRKG
jgi:hypothetical protein